jgi:hypothetical protein
MKTNRSEVAHATEIRARPYPRCIVCGAKGEPLYSGQTDEFGSSTFHTRSERSRSARGFSSPGGQLVLGTPNSQSLGHRFFKEDWIGLDPPRHLHVFSGPSMRRILSLAGLRQNTLHPVLGAALIYGSFMLRQGWTIDSSRSRSNLRAKIRTRFLEWQELCRVRSETTALSAQTPW